MKAKILKKTLKPLCIGLILTIAVTFGVPWATEGKTGSGELDISLTFDGIGKGLDPRGNPFDINFLKSDEVLKAALTASGLEGDYNTEQLRKLIVIKPQVGLNGITELTRMSSASGKTGEVAGNPIYTGEFSITVKDSGIVPNPRETLKLTESVADAYRKYFKESYLIDASTSSMYTREEIFSMDYTEMMMLMEQEADALVRYINIFAQNSPSFVSEKTGASFADLKSQAATVRDKEIGSSADIVDYYVLTRDENERDDYEKVKLKRADLTLQKDRDAASRIGYILDSYDNNTNYVIAPDSLNYIAESGENLYYGELMNRLVESKAKVIKSNYDVIEIQNRITKLSQETSESEKMRLTKSTLADAEEAYDRMEEIRTQAKTMAEENYDLNIGSKIVISKAEYKINTWGNILVNFVMLTIAVVVIQQIYNFFKGKEKGYIYSTVVSAMEKHGGAAERLRQSIYKRDDKRD